MKTNVKLIIAIALMATACTTGSKVTSGGYTDDLYFTPGDALPVAPRPKVEKEVKEPQVKSMVAMEVEENEQGKVVNNYVVPKNSRKDKNAYYFEEQPAYSDTTLEYKDDREQVTINNYFEGEEMDYTTRIRTFYNPYFYDPFWDPFWSPFYGPSFSFGWGWGGGYYPGWGGGWYNPWYSGYYGYGYGYGWGGWYDPWYSGYYGYGYGWGGGYYPVYASGNWNSGNYHTGMQNYTGRRGGSNAVKYGMNTNAGGLSGSSYNRTLIGRNSASSTTRSVVGNNVKDAVVGTRSASGNVGSTNTRSSGTLGTRAITTPQQVQGSSTTQGTRAVRGETISNLRRSNNNIQGSGVINQNGSPSRSNSSGRDYTPTYSRPRMNTQPSYNNGSTRQYSSPQSTYGNSSTNRYARPQGSASGGSGSVRSQSSGSYQRGSVSNAPTRSSDGGSYNSRSYSPSSVESSSPSRSYSAPASSGGGGGGGGSRSSGGGIIGGGSSSGGSGGSGRTR